MFEEEKKENFVVVKEIIKYEFEIFDLKNFFEKIKEEIFVVINNNESYEM